MKYALSKIESEKIIKHYGQEFYTKVNNDIISYSLKWDIEILRMLDSYSVNCIFVCKSHVFGDVILKICAQSRSQVLAEVSTLSEYSSKGFCKVYNSDIENGVILEEYITPGIHLKSEKSLDKRLDVFMSLFKGLHIEPKNHGIYPTYMQWVDKITRYMANWQGKEDFYLYMKKAREVCKNIVSLYPQNFLLHGDFHYYNILLGDKDEYRIIDPKGVIGCRVFDLPRYILNEYADSDNCSYGERFQKISKIISYFADALQIPQEIIKQSFFVETALGTCWEIEDGGNPDIQNIVFAEKIMIT